MSEPDRRRARAFGQWAEREVARLYERRGFRVLARNFRTRSGEVDLVVARDGLVAFVEVKAREREDYGTAEDAVSAAKRRRIAEAAEAFLAATGTAAAGEVAVRFDVASVTRDRSGRLVARLVEGAFEIER